MDIQWKIERIDEDEEADLHLADCHLRIKGRIEIDGRTAGQLEARYLCADDLASEWAFIELWDLDGETCAVYEQIFSNERDSFREPLPRLLECAPGLLLIDFIALRPGFRQMGLARAVIGEIVRSCADERTGAVLLDAYPLQHRNGGYEHFDEELMDLPGNEAGEDLERLMHHFRTWGMQRLPRTRYMVAAPDTLCEERAAEWPPEPVEDDWRCG